MDFVKKEFWENILFMPESTQEVEVGQTTAMDGEKRNKSRIWGALMADFSKSVIRKEYKDFRCEKN